MNNFIAISAAVLLCMCASSDAMSLGRQGSGRPRIIVIRQSNPASGSRVDQGAPTASAAPAQAAVSQTAPASGAAATASHAMPPVSALDALHNDLFLAHALDGSYMPYVDPLNYHMMENLGDLPYLPPAQGPHQGVDPLRSLLMAKTLDMPIMYL